MKRSTGFWMLAAAFALATAGCGLISAPVSVPAAIAENANFTFAGRVVDGSDKPLDGVVVTFRKLHHFWTPVKGSADVTTDRILRVDNTFNFDERGSFLQLTFTRDNFQDVDVRLYAEHPNDVTTRDGIWPNTKDFPVVMISTKGNDAILGRFNSSISYADYPVADCISLSNLATDGRSGDITFSGKDANDPTVFPAGTLYLTLDKQPPPAINAQGDIDPKDLDVPHHVTLHLPGGAAGVGGSGGPSGFIRIEPRVGFPPMLTSDTAPLTGYVRELTFTRERLKQMRAASPQDIMGGYEYFFFRAGSRYGKGVFSWNSRSGKPSFRYDLYIQPVADNRNLTTHKLGV